ncbi:hypothetical protein [Paenibacillus bouchesdurhonensis]|uniref:hypothetical protein n=1 Tax=Paenibacillus bouchesdurhonensis TaxID=1870990 RepID=UPI000DA62AF9|nr:hypothetical protein [Paenibacillus bouchesdurhonensis]
MREINIGEQVVRVRATPLALLFYKQEFKGDILGDIAKMQDVQQDISKLDTVVFLQLIWAMSKADSFGTGQFPSFIDWVASLDSFDVADPNILNEVLEEAASGFFRSGVKGAIKKR